MSARSADLQTIERAHSLDLVDARAREHADRGACARSRHFVERRIGPRRAACATADLLHLARGALRIVEVYGAALLAEEMEQVAPATRGNPASTRRTSDGARGADARDGAAASVLERVLGGGRDVPLVLLPLLNDLRAARGSALLSEGTLLLLNLGRSNVSRRGRMRRAAARTRDAASSRSRSGCGRASSCAARLDPGRTTSSRHLDELLARELEQLERAAAQPPFQLWWVVGAVLEALRQGGLEASVSIKRLLGHADRELKRLQRRRRGRDTRRAAGRTAEQPSLLRRARDDGRHAGHGVRARSA